MRRGEVGEGRLGRVTMMVRALLRMLVDKTMELWIGLRVRGRLLPW
jgi:hypothetical protein